MAGLEINLTLYDNEEALLAALKGGDLSACTCLVKRFASLLYQPALEILGDADEADAAVQSAFTKACDKVDSFKSESRLGTWLYRIAVNEALMARRRHAKSKLVHEQDITDMSDAVVGKVRHLVQEESPLDVALHEELHGVLAQAFEQLPGPLRQVVFLRTIQGLSTAETANQLNLREGTVKVNLHRARQRLRELLADYLATS